MSEILTRDEIGFMVTDAAKSTTPAIDPMWDVKRIAATLKAQQERLDEQARVIEALVPCAKRYLRTDECGCRECNAGRAALALAAALEEVQK